MLLPIAIIRMAYQGRMIMDEDGWLSLLKTRNLLIHTYSNDDALKAIESIKSIYVSLFCDLKQTIDENWMLEDMKKL